MQKVHVIFCITPPSLKGQVLINLLLAKATNLSNDDGTRLQMDLFMFHSHDEDPMKTFRDDWSFDRMSVDQIENEFSNLLSVLSNFLQELNLLLGGQGGPVVVVLQQVVPRHLVHPDRERGLQTGIDPGKCNNKLDSFLNVLIDF